MSYVYGYIKGKIPGVSSRIRSVIAACVVSFFVGSVLGYVAFKKPEIPWFYYPIAGIVLVTVFAGRILLHLVSGFVRKGKNSIRVLS